MECGAVETIPEDPEVIATSKYRDDPIFRSLVDGQTRMIEQGYTGLDLALAASLAQIIASRRR